MIVFRAVHKHINAMSDVEPYEIGIFMQEEDAESAIKIYCRYENKRPEYCSVKSTFLYEKYQEFTDKIDDDLRKKALNKLTYQEKKLLGLVKQ